MASGLFADAYLRWIRRHSWLFSIVDTAVLVLLA